MKMTTEYTKRYLEALDKLEMQDLKGKKLKFYLKHLPVNTSNTYYGTNPLLLIDTIGNIIAIDLYASSGNFERLKFCYNCILTDLKTYDRNIREKTSEIMCAINHKVMTNLEILGIKDTIKIPQK